MGKKALLLVPVLMFLLLLSAGSASAFEPGQARGLYPNGAEDCYAGCLPPPGTYFISYNAYGQWDRAYDYKGHRKSDALPGTKGDAFFTSFRFIKGTGCKILGADWYMHIILPVTYVHLNTRDLYPGSSNTAMANITIDPIILGWHFGDWHFAAALDINLPAPGWKKGGFGRGCSDLTNPACAPENNGFGTGYYNVEPIFAFTYLNKSGFEVGAKFMYDYNWTNWQTGYQTGQEFHFDWAVAQKFKNGFLASIVGYAYWQLSKDEFQNHALTKNSDESQIFGIGPMFRYDYKNMFFLLKGYREFEVKGTFSADWIWFKWFYAF